MDIDEITRACNRMLKEAGEFREVADSLPPTDPQPDITTTPSHLRWRN